MDGSGSGDGAKENDDLRLEKNLEFKRKREMDLCGSGGDRAKVSKLVPDENQPPISAQAAWFLASRGWSRSDTDWTSSDSDGEFCEGLKREAERHEAKFRELRRKSWMYVSAFKLGSEENHPPKYENDFEDSDSDPDCQIDSDSSTDSDPDCQIDSDSDEEEGGWYGLYERDSSSNKEPGETTKYCAQLAMDAYNKREGTRYMVVDIIRSEKCTVVGFVCFVSFTAKLFNEHDDDAITFRAEVLVNDIDDITEVEFVERQTIGPLTKEEMTHALGRDRYR